MRRVLPNENSLWSHFIAGAVAGTAQCVFCSPMELAKTRMQVQGQGESLHHYRHTKHLYEGPVDCLVKIFKTEGVPGVFRGMGLTVVRETPSFGVYFATYEYFNDIFRDKETRKVGIPGIITAGGFAGMASWMSTYPADVVKSRVQADVSNEYKGFWDCCVKSYRSEGIRFFGKGLCSTMLRAFPVNAATFLGVELVLSFREQSDKENDGSYELSALESASLENTASPLPEHKATKPGASSDSSSKTNTITVVPNLSAHYLETVPFTKDVPFAKEVSS